MLLHQPSPLLPSEKTKISCRHQKKLSVLIQLKRTSDGITENLNKTIVNLRNPSLSSDELEVLKLRLGYELATRSNQLEIMAVDVWRQVRYVQDKIKNSLRSFTYNHIDLDFKDLPRKQAN